MLLLLIVTIESVDPTAILVNFVFKPIILLSIILIIFPIPFYVTSWGLYTGIAPVPLINGPITGLLHDTAAAIKLMGLLTMAISSLNSDLNYHSVYELVIMVSIYNGRSIFG
jgi:hypothetical protein